MCYSGMVERDLKKLMTDYDAVVDSDATHAFEERFFPGNFAPVLVPAVAGPLKITAMKYGVPPPKFVRDPKRYTAFNARRDNLTSPFWGDAFMKHHGFIELLAFYEWVAVGDLLKAGVVGIDAVKAEFARQTAERKAKIEAAGKKYKMTPTEQKDPRFRQIVIEFKPQAHTKLLVPVIHANGGFAIVTDEPQPSVIAAGHDRSPIFLEDSALRSWLSPSNSTAAQVQTLLGRQLTICFAHRIAQMA